MAIFLFSQFYHKLFWRYFKRLHVFLAPCGYFVRKWQILVIVEEGVNMKPELFSLMEFRWQKHL